MHRLPVPNLIDDPPVHVKNYVITPIAGNLETRKMILWTCTGVAKQIVCLARYVLEKTWFNIYDGEQQHCYLYPQETNAHKNLCAESTVTHR